MLFQPSHDFREKVVVKSDNQAANGGGESRVAPQSLDV